MAPTHSFPEADTEERRKLNPVVTDRDIVFNCPTCQGELVVDQDGAGLEVPCSHCGQTLIVPALQSRADIPAAPVMGEIPPASAAPPLPVASEPAPAPPPVPRSAASEPVSAPANPPRTFGHGGQTPEQLARRLDELKHQLKENRSQDTEMRGHVNRATMELHRLQLRLKKLQERQGDIQAELGSVQAHLGPGPA